MTSAELWAAIALLALAGWSFSNYTVQRSFVPITNAFSILEKLNERIDNQIRETLARIQQRTGGTVPAPSKSVAPPSPHDNMLDQVNQVLGAAALSPMEEQPDSGESIEIAEGA